MKVYVVKKPGRRLFVLRWIDPATGSWKERSSGTPVRRDAERLAAKLETELRTDGHIADDRITWAEFRKRYEDEKLAHLSDSASYSFAAMADRLELCLAPRRLVSLNVSAISRFGAFLRSLNLANETVVSYLKSLRAALGWAKQVGLLAVRPKIDLGSKSKHRSQRVRCQPLTNLQYAEILAAAPSARPIDFPDWEVFIQGLWHSGLRISEACRLSWDRDDSFSVDMTGEFPRYRILSDGEKGQEDRFLPLVPDWGQTLLNVPSRARRGRVFAVAAKWQPNCIQKGLRAICGKSGAAIATNARLGKYASAHDFRASFGSRWAKQVAPAVLQQLMRHKSIDTTMDFYVDLNADELGRDLWEKHHSQPL